MRLAAQLSIMKLYETLRGSDEIPPEMRHNEFVLLADYRPQAAINIYQSAIAARPDDKVARLYLSALGLRLRRQELVCSDPSLLPGVGDEVPHYLSKMSIHVLSEVGQFEASIRLAYDLLRRRFDDINAHRTYIYLFMRKSVLRDTLPMLMPTSVVKPGMAVELREVANEETRWVTIEDGPEPDAFRQEFEPKHPLCQALLDKGVEEVVPLAVSAVQPRKAKIVAIASKFVRLYQYCLSSFQVMFPGATDIQMLTVASKEEDGSVSYNFDVVRDTIEANNEHVQRVIAQYPEKPFPLAAISNLIGRELFDLIGHLIDHPDKVIAVCDGRFDARDEALAHAASGRQPVLDASAIFTLVMLRQIEVLTHSTVRPAVSQATYMLVADYLEELSEKGGQQTLRVDSQGQLYMEPVPESIAAAYVERWQRAITVIRNHCEILDCPDLASLDSEERDICASVLGQDGLETAMLARAPDRMLWTDDVFFAFFARERLKVDRRVWTQVALSNHAEKGLMQWEEFNKCSALMMEAGYDFTWWNVDIFVEAADRAKWNPEDMALKSLIRDLHNPKIDLECRLAFAFHIVVRAHQGNTYPVNRNATVIQILNSLKKSESEVVIYGSFLAAAKHIFGARNKELLRELQAIMGIWKLCCWN